MVFLLLLCLSLFLSLSLSLSSSVSGLLLFLILSLFLSLVLSLSLSFSFADKDSYSPIFATLVYFQIVVPGLDANKFALSVVSHSHYFCALGLFGNSLLIHESCFLVSLQLLSTINFLLHCRRAEGA